MNPSQVLNATACVKATGTAAQGEKPFKEIFPSQDEQPVVTDLGGGLCVSYLVDEGDHLSYVQQRHLAAARVEARALHKLGLINLARIAEEKLRVKQYGPIFAILLDGHFEASLLLLDDLWDETLAHLTPNGAVAALPARDVLAFCDAKSAQGIAELTHVVDRTWPRGDHLLAQTLYRRQDEQWVPLRQ